MLEIGIPPFAKLLGGKAGLENEHRFYGALPFQVSLQSLQQGLRAQPSPPLEKKDLPYTISYMFTHLLLLCEAIGSNYA